MGVILDVVVLQSLRQPHRPEIAVPHHDDVARGILRNERGSLNVLSEIEAIEVHDLVPGCNEVPHELLFRIVLRINLGEGPQLGV